MRQPIAHNSAFAIRAARLTAWHGRGAPTRPPTPSPTPRAQRARRPRAAVEPHTGQGRRGGVSGPSCPDSTASRRRTRAPDSKSGTGHAIRDGSRPHRRAAHNAETGPLCQFADDAADCRPVPTSAGPARYAADSTCVACSGCCRAHRARTLSTPDRVRRSAVGTGRGAGPFPLTGGISIAKGPRHVDRVQIHCSRAAGEQTSLETVSAPLTAG